jgi:chromosome segregation ATPase
MKDDIEINEKNGISVEEQKEILDTINKLSEKNRHQLSDASAENNVIHAKKNNALFPAAVNIAAVIILVLGAFLLVFFNQKTDEEIKAGHIVYNMTERALIEEIRKDTAAKIAAKESEIDRITSRLNQVDDELLTLYSSNEELTAEQRAAQTRLLAMQNAFREELGLLQDERSLILENSRAKEANLRAQMEQRTREFSAAQQKASGELEAATRELELLRKEKERLDAAEKLFAGGLALVNERGSSDQGDQFDLMAKNAQLQDNISEMQKTIDALSSGGSGLTNRIAQLQDQIKAMEHNSEENKTIISELEAEKANNNIEIARLKTENTAKDQQITNLNTQLTAIRQLLQDN